MTKRLRVLLLGPDCHPEQVSIPYVAYRHAAALAEINDVTILAGEWVEGPLKAANASFRSIEIIRMPLLHRFYAWSVRHIFRNNYDTQALTAFGYPFALAFEWYAWRRMRGRIRAGEFDVVLRLLPMTPVLPSPFAYWLRKGPIPFVVGPLNGGLRSAPGFSRSDKENEWVWRIRSLARRVPLAASTYRHASAILLASWHMRSQFEPYRDKLFFNPENGIPRDACVDAIIDSPRTAPLELIFVGGLVRRKACYIALRAAASLLRDRRARFTIVGDGPERLPLEQLVDTLGIRDAVVFRGWLAHRDVVTALRASDAVVLPAIREGGGGVVFEALGSGAVPVILDYGGPGDIVQEGIGYKVAPRSEDEVVEEMAAILERLANDRDHLAAMRRRGLSYARECLTWERKAHNTTRVLAWVTGLAPKPDLRPETLGRLDEPVAGPSAQ